MIRGKSEEEWGEKKRGTCCKNPSLFISAAADIRTSPIGSAVVGNLATFIK